MSFRQLSRLQSISEIFTIYFHVFYWIHLKVFFEIKWNTFFLLDFPFCVSESLYNSELFTFVVTVVILLIAVITQHSTARQIVSNWESRDSTVSTSGPGLQVIGIMTGWASAVVGCMGIVSLCLVTWELFNINSA